MSLRGGAQRRRSNLLLHMEITSSALVLIRALRYSTVGCLLTTCLLIACQPIDSPLPTETPAPDITPSPTQTIVWFPPSATPTLLQVPTYTATPEMSPGIGGVILDDDFSDASQDVWDTARSNNGSASIMSNRLTLNVQPGYYLSSMRRQMPLNDFYGEITAHPSLCRGEDNYGILVRGVGSSFYRFVLTCDRQIRAERITGGTKLVIYQPVASGDAPGAPGEVRIGIWAAGSEMRLFLNGRFQFSVTEKTFSTGAFGVYVRSTGDTPVTVVFSDLKVYDVSYTPPTRTPMP